MISPSHYEYVHVDGLGKVVGSIPTASIFGLALFFFISLLIVEAGVHEFLRLCVDLRERGFCFRRLDLF